MRFEEKCTDKSCGFQQQADRECLCGGVLTNHAFGFGTAITRRAMYDSNYTKFIKDHFNWLCLKMNPNGIQMNQYGNYNL